jgi:hypothetical protein
VRSFFAAIALVAAGCGSSYHGAVLLPTTSVPPTERVGEIVGVMRATTGRLCGTNLPVEADVTVSRYAGQTIVAKVHTDRNGRFRVPVDAGRYFVVGTGPRLGSPFEGLATVHPGQTTTVHLGMRCNGV